MAIWQYDFYIVNETQKANSEPVFTEVKKESLNMIEKFLPNRVSWTEDIRIYGDTDSTCIELFHTKNLLEGIRIRIDLRNNNAEILKKLIKFIQMNHGKILANETIAEPTLKNLILLIKKSNEYKFCNAPRKYLENENKPH